MSPHLNTTLESGLVTRYHARPTVAPQTLAQHCWGVAVLLMYLTEMKCTGWLLMEAILHDSGEIITGDIPFTVKRDNPELKKMLLTLEIKARDEHTISAGIMLPPDEVALLKVCDTLEGFIWCSKFEHRRSETQDRWHQAYLTAREKFADLLTDRQWELSDLIFTEYGGILSKPEGAHFEEDEDWPNAHGRTVES